MGISRKAMLDKTLELLCRFHEWASSGRDDEAAFRAYEEVQGKSDRAMWESVLKEKDADLEKSWDPDLTERLQMAYFAGVSAARQVVFKEVESLLVENGQGHLIGKEPRRPVLVVDNTKREISSGDEGESQAAGPVSPGAA